MYWLFILLIVVGLITKHGACIIIRSFLISSLMKVSAWIVILLKNLTIYLEFITFLIINK